MNTKIKTFERLFRSLKYRQDERKENSENSHLKSEIEEAFCRDVGKVLEEIKIIQTSAWQAESLERTEISEETEIPEQTEICEQARTPEQIEIREQARTPKQNEIGDWAFNSKIYPGQYIILAGSIGLAGTILMAKYFHEELRSVFPAWLLRDALALEPQTHLYPPQNLLEKYGVSAAYCVGEGGLRRTLYQLGKDTGMGYEIQARYVPVNQITIEICEHFDLDPWSLFSGGCTLMICSRPAGLIQELKKQKIQSEVIGIMMDNNDKVITYGSTRSLVNRPKEDTLLMTWFERS